MRWAQRPDVGVVGPKMIYPSGTVNHSGIAVNLDSYVNLYLDQAGDRWGIFGHVDSYKNTSGLPSACQLMSRSTFTRLGRYDERYLLICSDIGICLEACRAGLRNVYTPYAVLIHDESTTRGASGDPSDDLDLAAREIVRLAYFEDPYFHPSLKPRVPTPSLRLADEPSSSEYFSWLLSRDNPGVLRDLDLDLYDDASVRDVAGRWSTGLGPGQWSPAKVGADPETAASFVLKLLRADASLRQTFPKALSEGSEGAFCRWLCSTEALTRYGLPATAPAMIRKVFEARLSAKIRLIYELRDDLQRTYPLAYLRAGRARFFRWLIAEGREQHDLSDASIWWFLIECDEDPARELVRSYKISPWWQRFFPDALTPVGWDRFAGWLKCRHGIDASGVDYHSHSSLGSLEELSLAYGCRGEWKRQFPDALQSPAATQSLLDWIHEHESVSNPRIVDWLSRIEADIEISGFPRTGMNVLAYFSYPSGHQESASRYVRSLNVVGVSTSCRDVPSLWTKLIRSGTSSSAWNRTTRRYCTFSRTSIFQSLMNAPAWHQGLAYIISPCGRGKRRSSRRLGRRSPSPPTKSGPHHSMSRIAYAVRSTSLFIPFIWDLSWSHPRDRSRHLRGPSEVFCIPLHLRSK